MNRYSSIKTLLGLASACLVLAACETNQSGMSNVPSSGAGAAGSKSGGHLIVRRIADLGSWMGVDLSVDGKHIATLVEGQAYDGYLPPGQHVLTAVPDPNRNDQAPFSVTLMVKNGQVHSFTARWQNEKMILKEDS